MMMNRPHSQTTPSPSPSRMNGYAGWSRDTGAIPCARASAQLIRPFPLSSHWAMLSFVRTVAGAAAGAVPSASMLNSVDEHVDNTRSRAAASRWSMVSPYFWRTATTLSANQQRLRSGSHSAASWSRFWFRFTLGLASVRLSGSVAKRAPGRVVGGTKTAVVRLGPRNHMLNVGLGLVGEPLAGVRTVDSAEFGDDAVLH